MKRTFFALFDDPREATAAIAEFERFGTSPVEHCSIIVHKHRLETNELELEETAAREGFSHGVTLGAGLGALIGAVVAGPFGLVGAGAFASALFSAGAGSIFGGMSSLLAGLGTTDPVLENLAKGLAGGQTLVTVVASELSSEQLAERLFREHGAKVVHKPVLGAAAWT